MMTFVVVVRSIAFAKATLSTLAASSSTSAAGYASMVSSSSSSSSSFTNGWLQKMKSVPIKYPMAFGIVLSGFKTSFSDLLVQKVVERKEKVDWKRNAAFATFGFVYLGGIQYILYVPIFGRLFPHAAKFAAKPIAQKVKDVKGILQLAGQTFLDQCVHHPLMYFPAFYITKELVMAKNGKPDIPRVLADCRTNMMEDLQALWKIWVPAMLVNFAFMPMHLRIPFVAGVSLLWTMVLSAMRGGDVVHGEDIAGGFVTGSTYQLLLEGLDAFNTTAVEMDGTAHVDHFSLNAAGKQRPGLVALLARHVADHGGNVTHSKMVRLGQEFIIQMHVSVPKDKSKEFMRSLKYTKHLRKELDIQATPLTQRVCPNAKAVIGLRIHAVGEDRYVIDCFFSLVGRFSSTARHGLCFIVKKPIFSGMLLFFLSVDFQARHGLCFIVNAEITC
jgi:predicted amino acid-binding ACT domain protein